MQGDSKAVVRRFYEAFGSQNLDEAFGLLDSSLRAVSTDPAHPRGLDEFKAFARDFYRAFPDGRMTIEDIVAEGDRVMLRGTCSGTHRAEFEGIPPTGAPMRIAFFGACRVANGRIVELWELDDMATMMQQLGLLPTQEEQVDRRPGSTELRH